MSASVIPPEGTWTVASRDRRHRAVRPLPGDVHPALIAEGVVPDPYMDRNERPVRWVAEADRIARRSFTWNGGAGSWYVEIDGLDRVADVVVNGEAVLSAANAFRRYRPIVTEHLRLGANTVKIEFHSNAKRAAELQAAQPFRVPYAARNCPSPMISWQGRSGVDVHNHFAPDEPGQIEAAMTSLVIRDLFSSSNTKRD